MHIWPNNLNVFRFSWSRWFILWISILSIGLSFLSISFLELVELKAWDLHFRQRGTKHPSGQIVFVSIDEESVNKIGRWPWPRRKMALLLQAVEKSGAKAIGLDMGFFEPDLGLRRQAILDAQQAIRTAFGTQVESIASFLNALSQEEDDDMILAQTIRSLSIPIVLGHFFYFNPKGFLPPHPPVQVLNKASISLVRQLAPPAPGTLAEATGMETNLSLFEEQSPFSASFNVFADPDGTVRWMPLVIRYEQRLFPSLALQTLSASFPEHQLMVVTDSYGIFEIRFGPVRIPTNNRGEILVNHYGPGYTFPYFSAVNLMEAQAISENLKNRIVIIGNTTVGLHDMRPTPFDPVFPGVELHCAVMENILNQDFLSRSDRISPWLDMTAIILLAVLFGFLLRFTSGFVLAAGVLVLIGGYIGFSHYAFLHLKIWINHIYPLFNLIILYIGTSIHSFLTEEREKRRIRQTFGLYVQDSVVEKMLKHPELLRLGGEKKELTVLFSDIRGFTTLSESLPPEQLVTQLNEYLTEMTQIVLQNQGTLDKYIGDAIMAIFGAPLDDPDHARHACETALQMNERLKSLQERWIKENKPPLAIGIGINTGAMIVGNMGSERRFDYTVLGDNVNLASRLEGLTKMYGVTIIVSDSTWKQIGHIFWGRQLDRVRVKGKHQPVGIHEIMARKEADLETMEEAIRRFEDGIQAYMAAQWDTAISHFESVLALIPNDPPSTLYIHRCQQLVQKPPDAHWECITTIDYK
uniref:Adenylate/guanylate cyclase domain-containing protein n=1 Tax=Desulfatirhabdium butyrativorans TaxID=340467 RepID=A0A7C4VS27_9BACT